MSAQQSYRPHDPGHNYYAPGIYLITLVVRDRREQCHMFGSLNDDMKSPGVVLSEVGKAVLACWDSIPERQAKHGRKVKVHRAVCMPDHFHGVIEVEERMDKSLGEVIRGFKSGCTKAWRDIRETRPSVVESSVVEPNVVKQGERADKLGLPSEGALPYLDEREMLKRMSKRQRAEYYAQHPEAQQPLWDDNYDDTICLSDPITGAYDQRHFAAMLRYVDDNPRRAIIRWLRPQYMQRCLHVRIDGRDYAAFGNLFLLRWARKVQVFCHRKAADGRTPYEQTEEYRRDCVRWKKLVMDGGTVIVTPGISKGERIIKDRCLESGYPLIHLQKEAIGAYWKPEEKRFNACVNGALLVLAPWKAEALGEVNGVPSATEYSMFHNLNKLAEEICEFYGDAVIVGGKVF